MRRLATSLAAFALTLSALIGLAVALRWPEARDLGRESSAYHALVEGIGSPSGPSAPSAPSERPALPLEKRKPRVVWFGDSTIVGTDRVESYPNRIRRQLQRHVEIEVVPFVGSSFWEGYFLSGRLAEQKPVLVILIANLRCMPASAHVPNYNTLAAMIPGEDLRTAVRLPLHEIGLSLPRLLLLRALRVPALEELAWFASGLRQEIASGAFGLPLYEPTLDLAHDQQKILAWYAEPVREEQGSLRAMQAALALFSRHGIATLVVVTPIPVDALREAGLYREDEVRESVEVIRRTAEASGARVVDLHDRVTGTGFRDASGHLSVEGAQVMARATSGPILEILADRGVEIPKRLRRKLVPAPER